MNSRICVMLLATLMMSSSLWSQGLKTVKPEGTGIKIQVPKEFVAMIPEDIVQRFPSVRRPLAAYTNEDRTADLTVKISATRWGEYDLELAQSFFKASYTELFDKVEMIDEGIIEVRRDRWIYFEFNSYLRGTDTRYPQRNYNYISYLIKNDKTLVVSFSCPQRDSERYRDRVKEIMTTVKVRKF